MSEQLSSAQLPAGLKLQQTHNLKEKLLTIHNYMMQQSFEWHQTNLPQLETHQFFRCCLHVLAQDSKVISLIQTSQHLSNTQHYIITVLLRTQVYYSGHLRQQTVQSSLLQFIKTGDGLKAGPFTRQYWKEILSDIHYQPQNRQVPPKNLQLRKKVVTTSNVSKTTTLHREQRNTATAITGCQATPQASATTVLQKLELIS